MPRFKQSLESQQQRSHAQRLPEAQSSSAVNMKTANCEKNVIWWSQKFIIILWFGWLVILSVIQAFLVQNKQDKSRSFSFGALCVGFTAELFNRSPAAAAVVLCPVLNFTFCILSYPPLVFEGQSKFSSGPFHHVRPVKTLNTSSQRTILHDFVASPTSSKMFLWPTLCSVTRTPAVSVVQILCEAAVSHSDSLAWIKSCAVLQCWLNCLRCSSHD